MAHSETSKRSGRPGRSGVAIFVVLGAILLVTLLGFAGLAFSESDARNSGSILDLKSRDEAAWAGIDLALARLQADPVATAQQLSAFLASVANNSSNPSAVLDRFVFTATGFTLAANSTTPQFYAPAYTGQSAANAGDSSAASVVLLSVDIGTPVLGALTTSGIIVTLQSTGQGRKGDRQTVVASYRMLGISPQQNANAVVPASISNALYLSGDLSNTNIGNNIQGDVYVSGNVSLNSSAPQTVNGRFRVNGNFSSNAPLTVSGDSWIGGYIYTNSGAPMTFQGNLGVGSGIGVMNANLTVLKNFNLYGSATGSWNTATLTVGEQLYFREQYKEIGGKLVVGGNAFFDNSLWLRGGDTSTFGGYLGVRGDINDNIIENGQVRISGNAKFSGTRSLTVRGANLNALQNLELVGPISQVNSGRIVVGIRAKFLSGISGIGNAIPDAIRIGDGLYLNAPSQASFNGGVSAGQMIWMMGGVDAAFCQNSGSGQWSLDSNGGRVWSYQNSVPLSGGQEPRVRNSQLNNASSHNGLAGSFPPIFAAPVGQPYGLTGPPINMRDQDTITSLVANPPDTFAVNATQSPAVDAAKVVLTDSICAAAGASNNNWTAADFNKVYNFLRTQGRVLNDYMILQINSSSSLGNVNTAGGTFTGKAVFIIEKSINVNGNWPASANASAIQVVYVRGSGSLGQFGSQGDIYGLIYYANNAGSLTQSWGPNSKLYGAMQFADGANYTGNSGTLSIAIDTDVISDISTNLPSALRTVDGSNAAPNVNVVINSLVVVPERGAATRIQFLRLSAFR